MKFIKFLLLSFIISIALVATGVSAQTYMFYALSLKSLKGETDIGSMDKTELDSQVLVIDSVHENRSIDFKMIAYINNSSYDSGWKYVEDTNNRVLELHGGILQEMIAKYPGKKDLKMRTVGFYLTSTPIGGSWWISMNEYLELH